MITVAGVADNVVGLVYVSGYALEEGESLGELQGRFPDSDLAAHPVYLPSRSRAPNPAPMCRWRSAHSEPCSPQASRKRSPKCSRCQGDRSPPRHSGSPRLHSGARVCGRLEDQARVGHRQQRRPHHQSGCREIRKQACGPAQSGRTRGTACRDARPARGGRRPHRRGRRPRGPGNQRRRRVMMSAIHVVIGATGAQGGAVAHALPAKGLPVRAVVRRPQSAAAQRLVGLGAALAVADLDDPKALAGAFAGAAGVFALTTPFERGPDEEMTQGISIIEAANSRGPTSGLLLGGERRPAHRDPAPREQSGGRSRAGELGGTQHDRRADVLLRQPGGRARPDTRRCIRARNPRRQTTATTLTS